jgi:hypothetical protein
MNDIASQSTFTVASNSLILAAQLKLFSSLNHPPNKWIWEIDQLNQVLRESSAEYGPLSAKKLVEAAYSTHICPIIHNALNLHYINLTCSSLDAPQALSFVMNDDAKTDDFSDLLPPPPALQCPLPRVLVFPSSTSSNSKCLTDGTVFIDLNTQGVFQWPFLSAYSAWV